MHLQSKVFFRGRWIGGRLAYCAHNTKRATRRGGSPSQHDIRRVHGAVEVPERQAGTFCTCSGHAKGLQELSLKYWKRTPQQSKKNER